MLSSVSERHSRRIALLVLAATAGCSSIYEPPPSSSGGHGQVAGTDTDDDDDSEQEGSGEDEGGAEPSRMQESDDLDDDADQGGETGEDPLDEGTSGWETDGTWVTSGYSTGTGSSGAGDDGSDTTSHTPGQGCPARLPDGWLFCEDFESGADLRDVFFEYQDGGGLFVRANDAAASGQHSMRATYMPGAESAGWLSVAVGRTPEAFIMRPAYVSDEVITELYWRVWVRTQPGWPDAGPHSLATTMSLTDADFGQALTAVLASNGDGVTLRGLGDTCVASGDTPCGNQQNEGAVQVASFSGSAPLFSAEYAGEWHCIEAHVRLNDTESRNGAFEVWVDGIYDGGNQGVAWRDHWADFGLNLITFENFWIGGAPEELHRWFDDIVVAREPVGCD